MGQGSSAEPEPNTGGGAQGGSASGLVKTCYYELLAVARDATQDEYIGGHPFLYLYLLH